MIVIPDEVREELNRLTDELAKLEEEGRSIAYNRDVPDYVRKTQEWMNRLLDVLDKMEENIIYYLEDVKEFESVRDFVSELRSTLGGIWKGRRIFCVKDAERCIREGIDKPKDCIISHRVVNNMKLLDKASRINLGEGCVYLAGVLDPYTLSAWVNDYTACVHRFIERMRRLLSEERIKEKGRFYIIYEDASPEIEKLIKTWARTAEEFYKFGQYYTLDLEKLFGIAFDDKIELRVGDTAGHRTHIYTEKNRVEYHDTDKNVNRIMYDLLTEYANCKCKLEEERGVFCSECNLDNAVKILAGATSCDIRLENECRAKGIEIGAPDEEIISKEKERILKMAGILQ